MPRQRARTKSSVDRLQIVDQRDVELLGALHHRAHGARRHADQPAADYPGDNRADDFQPDTILVSRTPGETRYALLSEDTLLAVVHRRDADAQPGAVYHGRVRAPVPGTGAVFWSNGRMLGEVRDPVFARLFFGIWLSTQTSEPQLRRALLAQAAVPTAGRVSP